MPSASRMFLWRREHPDFDKRVKEARVDRGDILYEKVVDIGMNDETIYKDEVPGEKMKLGALKWAASKANPDEYGDRTKVVGDKDAPVMIVLDTGIRRKPIEMGRAEEIEADETLAIEPSASKEEIDET